MTRYGRPGVASLEGMAALTPMSFQEDFHVLDPDVWDIYDSAGHDDRGRRSPGQVSVVGGVLTITGTADGTTGGLKWRDHSQRYGQWDIRLRAARGSGCYHPVVLLWGTEGGAGVDNALGEIDIVEVWQRPERDRNAFSVHYGDGSEFVGGDTAVDMTQWHTYHLVWQDSYLYTWIDDEPAYFSTDRLDVLPPGPMDLTIQLDWFPDEGATGDGTASMEVDWIAQHRVPPL
jgi:Glycosyl hydrolases family 16